MFALLGSWSCSFDKYILWYGQIHFAISTNTFCNFDKYILQKHDIHIRFARVLEAGQYGFNIIEISKLIRTEETVILKTCRQWKDPKPQIQYKKSWPKITGLSVCSFFIIVCFCYCYCLFVIVVCYCYRAVCVQLSQVNRVNEGDVVGRMPIQAKILIKMFN